MCIRDSTHTHTHTRYMYIYMIHVHIIAYTCIFQSVVHSLGEETSHNGHSKLMEAKRVASSLPFCSAKDRTLLLALALKWKKESAGLSASPEQLCVFERKMWV